MKNFNTTVKNILNFLFVRKSGEGRCHPGAGFDVDVEALPEQAQPSRGGTPMNIKAIAFLLVGLTVVLLGCSCS